MVVTVNTDGGARGNPGLGAIGVVIKNEKRKVREIGKFIGKSTNEAEYKVVIEGLKACEEMKGNIREFLLIVY